MRHIAFVSHYIRAGELMEQFPVALVPRQCMQCGEINSMNCVRGKL